METDVVHCLIGDGVYCLGGRLRGLTKSGLESSLVCQSEWTESFDLEPQWINSILDHETTGGFNGLQVGRSFVPSRWSLGATHMGLTCLP